MLIHALGNITEEDYDKIVTPKTGQLNFFTVGDSIMKSIYVDLKRTEELDIATKGIELLDKDIKPGDVIIFKFDPQLVDGVETEYIRESLSTIYPDNVVIGIADDIELLEKNPEQAIDMLEKMIAHIKVKSGIKKPDIVIPR